MKTPKALATAIVVFLLIQSVGLVLARLFHIRGSKLGVLFAGLVALGAIASTLVYLLQRSRSGAKGPSGAGAPKTAADEIELAFAAARTRLARRPAGAAKLGELPLLLVLGPSGATKTTVVANSGLDAELLAGEVHRGDSVVPTAAVNLWYAQDLVLAEAGGALSEEPERWARLARHLRPGRWRAAFARRSQAHRAVLVCYPCDAFLRPGSTQSVPAAARALRGRLVELSHTLGIRLPVYVLFTKADRIPYFEDYVRSWSREEAQQVLGATLPLLGAEAPGVYAEGQSQRVAQAFRGLLHSLSLRRLDVLPREAGEEIRAGAYEFPREFGKVSDLATEFLVELCKPSQLQESPFLRGFYFTGVRPVVVSESVVEAPAAQPAAGQISLGATSVFSAHAMQQAQHAAAPSMTSGSRRMPEWVFLRRVFRDVILHDDVARHITGGGVRVNVVRRALIGTAAMLFLVFSVGLAVSYRNNRALGLEAEAAARGVEALTQSELDAPPAEALQRLDALREQTARLSAYEREGRPWRLGWGLYTGHSLHPALRQLYFDRFQRLLWGGTRTDLVSSLQALPDAPRDAAEFAGSYDALKAYLITTRHPERSSADFLTPALLRHWAPAGSVDADRLALVRRQFDFYGAELPHGNPYADEASEALTVRTRGFLHNFSGFDRFYQSLLGQAGAAGRDVQFNRDVPGSEAVLRNAYVVPAAFTHAGWESAQATLKNLDVLFERESWVVGEQAVVPAERAKLAQQLRQRYVADYIEHWRNYLHAGSIAGSGSLAEAGQKLGRLAGNQSPLLQMFALASEHTAVDSLEVSKAFQPVHAVVPPGATERLVGDGNAPYVQALLALQSALEQAAKAPAPERPMAYGQASSSADQVRMSVRQMAQGFSIEGPAREVGSEVQRLMLMTAAGVDGLAKVDPAGEVNGKGPGFCQQFTPVLRKFPFSPRASAEATVQEVSSVFQRGNGLLANFYNDALQPLLVKQGPLYVARIGATPQPTRSFIDFYNRANAVSEALYDERGAGPEVPFTIRPQTSAEFPEITISIDGQTQSSTRTTPRTMTFTWTGERAASARITARTAAGPVSVEAANGTWALFRLMHQASWAPLGAGRYRLTWTVQGQPLVAEIDFLRNEPVFRSDYFGNLGCVGRIAQ